MESFIEEKFKSIFEQDLLTEITSCGKLKSFKENDIIIDIGDTLKYIPLLIEGNIKVLREDDKGYELLLYILGSGDTCAMSLTCCMEQTKSKIRAVSENDSKIIMIPAIQMKNWFNTFESWRVFILERYQLRFNEMLDTIDTLAFMNMNERLFRYLENQKKLNGNGPIKKTHLQIAEDLHTSRVVISRLLKQMENDKKIKLYRTKIEIL